MPDGCRSNLFFLRVEWPGWSVTEFFFVLSVVEFVFFSESGNLNLLSVAKSGFRFFLGFVLVSVDKILDEKRY